MNVTLDSKILKALDLFRAEKDIRHYLNGFCLSYGEKGVFIVASDGITLGVHCVSTDPVEEGEYVISSADADIIVKQSAVLKANIVTFNIDSPSGKFDYNKRELRSATVTIGSARMNIVEHDAVYPDWRRILRPQSAKSAESWREGRHPAFFDPRFVARVAKAGEIIKGKSKIPTMLYPGKEGDAGFAALDYKGKTVAIVMPMRVDDDILSIKPAFDF